MGRGGINVWITWLAVLAAGCVVEGSLDDGAVGTDESGSTSDAPPEDPDAPNGDEAGNGFIPEDDDEPDPKACDPMNPVCELGDKCTLVRDADTSEFVGRCVPIAEQTVALGERCVPLEQPGHDNCEAGSVCWDIMNGEGTCLEFCQGSVDTPICEEGFVCNWGKSFDAGLCTPVCDPLLTTDCPETCGCYWSGGNFFCLPRSSDIATGEPCGFVNDCAPTNMCVTGEAMPDCQGSSCCAAFCDISQPDTCGSGTACTAFFEQGMAIPGYEDTGICVLPGA